MLDLTKLAGQLPDMGSHLQQQASDGRERVERGLALLATAQKTFPELQQKYQDWGDRLIFNCAVPLEPLDTRVMISVPPKAHTVFATDGSQIAPSHHEIAYCYLINVGRIMLHYGQSLHPLLDNIPEVFYRSEDLYISRKWGIRTEEWMGYCRTASEAQMLAEMACKWVLPPGSHEKIPNVAMVDGSLVYWFLENIPLEARERILIPVLEAWRSLRETKIPLIGYISSTRSIDAIHYLRLAACPHETPDCSTHCLDKNTGDRRPEFLESLPCQIIEPMRDRTLWENTLQPGERGSIWQSTSRILQMYPPEDQVCFCYVHVGAEVARVEFPRWLAEDPEKLDQTLGILLGQVHKGYGYPVAIAEAHNQAVIRGGDRARFFSLLEQQMVKAGLKNVGVSYKETRKRGSVA
ncbi:NurA domain-containing protein [[Leptolyngbya] sp. PCC 7376]|uniref:DNA double-strand break repair nuclease NurA n=1 Tax=[Leptolyngbya] sp. PCC 7376 TaxID=111781 RepID=UPI00029EF5DE|nr:DNA double-strand break repair nuclease NurA [[Leptolyngbya] sp. PCC 7376]AFY39193.1 NurA domain-containing protein [[Leptolyngbya] sp. PCC 7376]